MKLKLFLIFALVSSFSLFGDAIVSAKWLNQHKNDENIRIIFISNSLKNGLIPNSAITSIQDWRKKVSKFFVLKNKTEIEPLIQKLGIDEKSHVVIYSDAKTPKSLLFSSYVYWALNFYGITNISILDGGLKNWKKEKLEIVTKPHQYEKSNFKVKNNSSILVNLDDVKKSIGKVAMVDARPHRQFFGLESSNGVARLGHIKGAVSYPWIYSVDKNFKLIDKNNLEDIFTNGFKFKKEQEIITYCTGGLETSFNFFVLHGVLGYTNVKLYDSSMKEWGNLEDTPMEKY